MRVQGARIDGFGQFEDFTLDGLGSPLHVVLGPNEAGKTTLRTFIRWVIFGPRHGELQQWRSRRDRLAGTLDLAIDDARASLKRDHPNVDLLESGRLMPQHRLDALLGGLDLKLYEAMFSFDLFDLQTLEALKGDAVQNFLAVGASLGGGARASDVLKKLAQDGDRYWRPRAQDVEIRRARRAFEDARQHLAEAERAADQYGHLREQRDQLEVSLREAKAKYEHQRQELEHRQKMAEAWPVWSTLLRLEEAQQRDPDAPLPASTRQRIEALLQGARTARERRDDRARGLRDAEASLEAVPADGQRTLVAAAKIEALVRRQGQIEELLARGPDLQAAFESASAKLQSALQQLGDWDEARLASLTWDVAVEQEASHHTHETAALETRAADALDDAHAELEAATTELAAREREVETLAPEVWEADAGDLQQLLSEAASALEHHRREVEARAEREWLEALPLEVEGWLALDREHVARLEEWRDTWRHAELGREQRIDGAREHAAAMRREVEAAEQRVDAAKGAPGGRDLDSAELVAIRASWDGALQAAHDGAQLKQQHGDVGREAAALPGRLGLDADLATLRRVARDVSTRGEITGTFERLEGACASRLRLQEQVDHTVVPEAPSLAQIEARKAALEGRRAALAEAEAQLDALQRLREQALAMAAPKLGPSRWVAPVVLLGLAGALGYAELWPFAGAAALGALITLVIAARGGGDRDAGLTAKVRQAEGKARSALAKAGLAEDAGAGGIRAASAKLADAFRELESAQSRARGAADAAARLASLRGQLAEAEHEEAASRSQVRALLQRAGLPPDLGRESARSWLDGATELARLDAQRAELGVKIDRAERSFEAFRARVGALVEPVPDVPEALAELLRSLEDEDHRARAKRDEIRAAEAKLESRRQDLDRAERALVEAEALQAVPHELRASFATWADTVGVPVEVPSAEAVEQAKRAAEATERRAQWAQARREEERHREQAEPFLRALADWATRLEVTPSSAPAALLEALRERLEDARSRRVKREAAEARCDEALERVQRAGAGVEAAQAVRREYEAALQRFVAWRSRTGAGDELAPAGAGRWRDAVKAALVARTARDVASEQVRATDQALEGFCREAGACAGELGDAAPESAPAAVERVRGWSAELNEARGVAERRRERSESRDVAARQLQQTEEDLERATEALAAALGEIGCHSEAAWVDRVALDQQRAERRVEIDRHGAELQGKFGPGWWDADRWRPLVACDLDAWSEATRETLQRETDELGAEVEQLERELSETSLAVRELERKTDVVESAQRVEAAQAALDRARREWWRLRLAWHMLNETFERYRRERQPGVVKRAGKLFAEATKEGYVGLEVEEERNLDFHVRDQAGQLHPADRLSTGTTALLYLCLRLALMVDQVQRGRPVPVLMDDVLAHFDPERAEQAARLLVRVARDEASPQLLLFTCRPETVDVLRGVEREAEASLVGVTELERWGGEDGPRPRRSGADGGARALGNAEAEADAMRSELLEQAVVLLRDRGEPLSKGDFVQELGPDLEWESLRSALEADERVRMEGERRGRRYLVSS